MLNLTRRICKVDWRRAKPSRVKLAKFTVVDSSAIRKNLYILLFILIL